MISLILPIHYIIPKYLKNNLNISSIRFHTTTIITYFILHHMNLSLEILIYVYALRSNSQCILVYLSGLDSMKLYFEIEIIFRSIYYIYYIISRYLYITNKFQLNFKSLNTLSIPISHCWSKI